MPGDGRGPLPLVPAADGGWRVSRAQITALRMLAAAGAGMRRAPHRWAVWRSIAPSVREALLGRGLVVIRTEVVRGRIYSRADLTDPGWLVVAVARTLEPASRRVRLDDVD